MMNPSTADSEIDDATIRKCQGFSRRWGYDGIDVVNLFALRSRDPKALLTATDPIGPDNLRWLRRVLWDEDEVICAWGCEDTLEKHNGHLKRQADWLLEELRIQLPKTVHFECLGKTQGGTPRHPLMLAYSTERQKL